MPVDPVQLLQADPYTTHLAAALAGGKRVVAAGSSGSSTAFLASAVSALARTPVVLVVAHIDDADEARDELESLGRAVSRFPALEAATGDGGANAELFAERLAIVRELITAPGTPRVLAAPIQALMQTVPAPSGLDALARTITSGQTVKLTELAAWLEGAGYRRRDAIEDQGEYAIRGGIVDVFSPGGAPTRLDFFGDQVDRITEIDLDTMGSDRAVQSVQLVCVEPGKFQSDDKTVGLATLLPRGTIVILAETMEIVEQARGYYERVTDPRGILGPPAVLKQLQASAGAVAEINQFSSGAAEADERLSLPVSALQAFDQDTKAAVGELAVLSSSRRVIVSCQNEGERQRLGELLVQHAPEAKPDVIDAYIHRGFVWEGRETLAVVPYHELLNRFTMRRRAGRMRAGRAMDTFLDLQAGDYVVHQEHGIARFVGLQLLKPRDLPGHERSERAGDAEEYLTLEFAGRSKLHVPVSKIDQVQKYIGGFSGKPPLSTLGGQKWKSQKERAGESVRDLAAELMRVRAAREHMPGIRFPADTPWQTEFEAEFPYDETPDQIAALAEIKRDMQANRPMDRLLCGDVGFGKTELAIRAAFKACEFGKQVAVLVPTTVLAEQHERTFKSRFAGYPFRIESLSRFKSNKEANEILAMVRKGQVDVIIGTHRLLSADVRFGDLGVVIIDEEQRFGVEHKERLLRLRMTVDVLTLSATPIPRTLHMAMLGIRDISSLATPPLDRRAIVTEVIPYNERRLTQAIARELSREGQVYFVHNRVSDIKSVADDVQKMAPGARIVVGHGQMSPDELEGVMLKFTRRQADILVSTTIIESGIDIPSANTMIVNNADRFGLADLHQLRGRVGRSKHRAYCYLLLPPDRPVPEVAQKRLKAIEQYSMLGAGFKIAMRDLEIRGAGNILGAEQSGHIALVGYEMYCRLLEDAVHELKHEKRPDPPSKTSVEIGVSGVIPKPYIPSDQRRLEAYRRLSIAANAQELAQVEVDLKEAYGEPPVPVKKLIELAQLRIALAGLRVKTATIRDKDVIFRTPEPSQIAERLKAVPKEDKPASAKSTWPRPGAPTKPAESVVALPPKAGETLSEVYFRPGDRVMESPDTLLAILRRRLVMPVALQ
ncbi:MAG: transcription-repair coupling factor [Phycisphaerales bacterium]|nr:transcription-repair coupling factor [Phycisphaerales bacterium]